MDFGIAETGIARGSPPGTTTEVLRVGFPSEEIRVVSLTTPSKQQISDICMTKSSYDVPTTTKTTVLPTTFMSSR
jgi:hypothetical protein